MSPRRRGSSRRTYKVSDRCHEQCTHVGIPSEAFIYSPERPYCHQGGMHDTKFHEVLLHSGQNQAGVTPKPHTSACYKPVR
jgi:hypothetical protein